jgi:lysyl-tRNA synthetase class I
MRSLNGSYHHDRSGSDRIRACDLLVPNNGVTHYGLAEIPAKQGKNTFYSLHNSHDFARFVHDFSAPVSALLGSDW